MIMKKWIFLLFAVASLSMSCATDQKVKVLDVEEYVWSVQHDQEAVVLDVRTEKEFKQGHIEGAQLLDFMDQTLFDEGLEKLDKNKTYYIYCRSGRRSNMAAVRMQEQGFKVFDLKGGMNAWREAQKPVVQ